jgi:outer membrane protein insertion porin family
MENVKYTQCLFRITDFVNLEYLCQRFHYFLITGQEMPTSFQTVMRTVRMAYGIGMALRLGQMGRIELNYCIPALHQREDQPNPGVQFGIGIHFP